nr:hypothetical protein HmN_000952600 [Hymenolepis microstoma]
MKRSGFIDNYENVLDNPYAGKKSCKPRKKILSSWNLMNFSYWDKVESSKKRDGSTESFRENIVESRKSTEYTASSLLNMAVRPPTLPFLPVSACVEQLSTESQHEKTEKWTAVNESTTTFPFVTPRKVPTIMLLMLLGISNGELA